jgi:hypothetical protein
MLKAQSHARHVLRVNSLGRELKNAPIVVWASTVPQNHRPVPPATQDTTTTSQGKGVARHVLEAGRLTKVPPSATIVLLVISPTLVVSVWYARRASMLLRRELRNAKDANVESMLVARGFLFASHVMLERGLL